MKKLLKFIETVLILGFIFFEELVWYRFALPIYKKLQQLRLFARFDCYLSNDAGSLSALLIFLLPFLAMELMAITAGHFFISGQLVWGVTFYIFKILMAIPVVSVFSAAKEKLLAYWFIDYPYQFINWAKNTHLYQAIVVKLQITKQQIKKQLIVLKTVLKIMLKERMTPYIKQKGSYLSQLVKRYRLYKK